MNKFIKKIAFKLPVFSHLLKMKMDLDAQILKINADKADLEAQKARLAFHPLFLNYSEKHLFSTDEHPWNHPFLTSEMISRFREYSNQVWQVAVDYQKKCSEPLKIAFAVNMAQNMYKWGRLARKYGTRATLFVHPLDQSAISCPEWEEFDGEYSDIFDGDGFLKVHPYIKPEIPCNRISLEGSELYNAYNEFQNGNRKPLLYLLSKAPGLRHEILIAYHGFYPYYSLVKELSKFDVIYAASAPFVAYASGRPYCVLSVGGDLQYDCGRYDDYGKGMLLSFNAARFLLISNPHPLGHCRRLGLTNGVYLPYPMDDSKYCPGDGQARKMWELEFGKGIYVLMTSRIDPEVKGQDESFFRSLVGVAKERQHLRFIFLSWGNGVSEFRRRLEGSGLANQFIMLKPVGKKRLIDYYRSCDLVLDQFVFGYYGATGLEAASIGKPMIMKIRKDQYAPLYKGDVMPALNANTPDEMGKVLLELTDHDQLRVDIGKSMRDWLVRNHGEARTVPLMLALLRLTADQVPLPSDLLSPLWDEESEEERNYHAQCMSDRLPSEKAYGINP